MSLTPPIILCDGDLAPARFQLEWEPATSRSFKLNFKSLSERVLNVAFVIKKRIKTFCKDL